MTLIERGRRETVVLVAVATTGVTGVEAEESLDELAALADTAGADAAARVVQHLHAADPATFVGRGKAQELRDISEAVDADTVIFDDELSPAQSRNLEKILGRTAIDRTALILDIFAQHANSQEGKAQVELALLRYKLPRLRGRGLALSQQAGGIGTRGPGETQLEVDRRRLVRRVSRLEHELDQLARTRQTQRKARRRTRVPTVALVGYTNAGKSSLLNRLTGADARAEDRLFATVDPTTRRLDLPGGEAVLVSDTVGFVRKLPHQLVQAFRSTLDEVADADLLVHVVDGASPSAEKQMEAVRSVLSEIGAGEVSELVVFNKADLDPLGAADGRRRHPGSVACSAVTGEGMDTVIDAMAGRLRALRPVMNLKVPYDRGDVIAAAHRRGEVLTEEHGADSVALRVRVRADEVGRFQGFAAR